MNIYNIVFVGNRPSILKEILHNNQVNLIRGFTPKYSILENSELYKLETFDLHDHENVFDCLNNGDYDICVSAGCPLILPRSRLPQEKVFINSHPSVLPYGKGIHPINECIFSEHRKAGVTLHYLTDKLDAGDIIEQESFDITDDIDLSILYGFIFELEAEVFTRGIKKLIKSDLSYIGTPQAGEGTYYTRKEKDRFLNIKEESSENIVRKIKAFSTKNLGVFLEVNSKYIRVFKAHVINNCYLIKRYNSLAPGNIAINIENDCVVVKTLDGLVNITSWIAED